MTKAINPQEIKTLAQAVIRTEAKAVEALSERIDGPFIAACRAIIACSGRVVVSGMGKSGHIGRKIAATLASTGTPAFFIHPGEASHGDLGMVMKGDIFMVLSNSGTADELLAIIPAIRRLGVEIIAMTGNPQSALAQMAHYHINTGVEQEACPLGLAPTSSTTATLVMGDALAVSLLQTRGFTAEDFARSHPAGKLGKRLLVHVYDIMHTGSEIPLITPETYLKQAILEITRQGLGVTLVADEQQCLLGLFTDGDLRRSFENGVSFEQTQVRELMTYHPTAISPDALAVSALNRMQQHSITVLPVVQDTKIVGIIHMHDLLRAGIV